MSNQQSELIEITKLILDFLSNNSWQILTVSFLFICRNSIANLIGRITNFNWENGDSKLGLKAAEPNQISVVDSRLDTVPIQPQKLIQDQDLIVTEDISNKDWFSKAHEAFKKGLIKDAEAAFQEYAIQETDSALLEENKAFYLYCLYMDGKDSNAINQLENLVTAATTEDSKFTFLTWLAFCFRNSSQFHSEIELWQKAIPSFQAEKHIILATTNLAESMIADGKLADAREILILRLQIASSKEDRSRLFSSLSVVEKELGNKLLSVYCKDKSLEFDPDNRGELFNSAYQASDANEDDLSISNYVTLLRLDPSNSTALNNLGVQAQKLKLTIKAVEKYKASSDLNHTLAMANQGYMLLDAGFIKDAEEIAKKAIQMNEPHENVYSLLSRLAALQKEQDTKWEEIVNAAKLRQKFIRNYTYAYYFKSDNSFDGEWQTKNGIVVKICVENKRLDSSWKEEIDRGLSSDTFLTEISGVVTNSSFEGRYKKTNESSKEYSYLGLSQNVNFMCFGYVSNDGNSINIEAKDAGENFKISLARRMG